MLNIAVTAKDYPVDEKFTLRIDIKNILHTNNDQTWRVVLFQCMKEKIIETLLQRDIKIFDSVIPRLSKNILIFFQ